MAFWTVKLKAQIPYQEIEFELEVEADSKLAAESEAEDLVSFDMVSDKMDYTDMQFESEAVPKDEDKETEATG